MNTKNILTLGAVFFIFVFGFAGSCGQGSSTQGETASQSGITDGDAFTTDNLQAKSLETGFSTIAKVYGLQQGEIEETAQQAGFDPNNFNPENPENLAAFITFIHRAIPGLKDLMATSIYESSVQISGVIPLYDTYVNGPGGTGVPVPGEMFYLAIRGVNLLTIQWRNEVNRLAGLFGFAVPFGFIGIAMPPALEASIDDQIDLWKNIFALSPEGWTQFEAEAKSMVLFRLMTIDGVLYELDDDSTPPDPLLFELEPYVP